MNNELATLVKKLAAQVNVDAISTKDLVEELESLYKKVDTQETSLEQLKKIRDGLRDELTKMSLENTSIKEEYVEPYKELCEQAEKTKENYLTLIKQTDDESLIWKVEREFVKREASQLKEILSAVLSKTHVIEEKSWPIVDASGNYAQTGTKRTSVVTEKPDL